MQAAVVREQGRIEFGSYDEPAPREGEVVVELRAAALNRRDLGVVAGRYGDFPTPFVPGSATVLIGGSPALRMGDTSGCGAPILMGSLNVMIGG